MVLGETSPGSPSGSSTPFTLGQVTADSDFHIVTADGLNITAAQASHIPIDNRAVAITGKGGAVITLPNGNKFAIQPNSRVALDQFVYNPNPQTPPTTPVKLAAQTAADAQTGACTGGLGKLGGAVEGEFAIEYPNGFRVQNPNADTQIVCGMKLITGPKSRVVVRLPDETIFTLGSEAEVTIDNFVYDTDHRTGKIVSEMTKGVFRWVTGTIAGEGPYDMTLKIPNGVIGKRGTEFEVEIMPDHFGHITVFSGKVIYTQLPVGTVTAVSAGETITLDSSGLASAAK